MDIYYKTPEIQTLFESEDLSEIDYLLRNGLDVNSVNVFNKNAAFNASFEKTLFLEEKGINLFHEAKKGFNILFDYTKNMDFDKFKYLVEKGLSFNHFNQAGYGILSYLKIEQLEYLQKNKNFIIQTENLRDMSVFNGVDQPIAELLYKKYNCDPHFRSKEGHNTLFYNNEETLKYLISLGVDYTQKNNYGFSALHCAYVDSFKYLVSLGLDPHEVNELGQNLFCYVELDVAKYMAEELKIDPLDKNNGTTLLYWQDLDSLHYLISKGCINDYKKDDLIELLKYSEHYAIDYLLSLDIYKENKIHKEKNIYFQNIEENDFYAKKIMNHFYESGLSINIKDDNKNTLLMYHNNVDIKEKLIDSGVNINALNNSLQNVLFLNFVDSHHKAGDSDKNEMRIYNKLVEKGLNIYNRDDKGKTVLFHLHNPLVLADLIKKGVDADIVDEEGKPFWFYSNEVYALGYAKKECGLSIWDYFNFHISDLKEYVSKNEKNPDFFYFDGQYIKDYINKVIIFAKEVQKKKLIKDYKEPTVILSLIKKLDYLEKFITNEKNKKFVYKIIKKIILVCRNDAYFDSFFLLRDFASSTSKINKKGYERINLIVHKNPMLEYKFLMSLEDEEDCEKLLHYISWSKQINKTPLHSRIELFKLIKINGFYKWKKRLIKVFVGDILKENLNSYLNDKNLKNITLKMVKKYVPENNLNYKELYSFLENRDNRLFNNQLNKRSYIKNRISSSLPLQNKNIYNENILYFISSLKNYEICKKNDKIEIDNISEYGENALFKHIKELPLFYKISKKSEDNKMKEYLFKLIEDTEIFVEENNDGENIFKILEKLQEQEILNETFSLGEMITELENKKISVNTGIKKNVEDDKKRKRI